MSDKAAELTAEILEAQEAQLVFPGFSEDTAFALGGALVAAARAQAAPVVINIRTPDRTLFHAALPGSAPDNDHWARRKSNIVLRKHCASMLVGMRLEAAGKQPGPDLGLDPLDFAAHGGSFPIRVAGVGVIGAITVSGLASAEDHAMIVETLSDFLARHA
ncbi:heme-degrading domain-containing protein [Tropicimonas marinistellae]|uniref:heme-degrading domain-containing protein n=1 Tax=Tropicimonas marinistellae TaxID=1739787 RepID=UPI00082C5092|nr:heme-degrading domain-containing protein [Tropicimonas marinistellae]